MYVCLYFKSYAATRERKYSDNCKLSNRKMMSMHIHEFTRSLD